LPYRCSTIGAITRASVIVYSVNEPMFIAVDGI
jgi:hypothetical protein